MRSKHLGALAVLLLFTLASASGAAADQRAQQDSTPEITEKALQDSTGSALEFDQLYKATPEADETRSGMHQHGEPGGHLPASNANVDLVGKGRVSGFGPNPEDVREHVADVASLPGTDYAYLAGWQEPRCGHGGFYVMDISDPTNPQEVRFVPTNPGSLVGEGMQVIRVNTAFFKGDLLLHNNEVCGEGGLGGMSLWDVTNPLNPQPLALHVGDTSFAADGLPVNTIHSVFGWQQGDKAYATLVDNHELADVDIFDITNPRAPVPIAETGLACDSDVVTNSVQPCRDHLDEVLWEGALDDGQLRMGSFAAFFHHDLTVKQIDGHWYMLVSYWDPGYIILNIDDPANPVFVDDSTFPNPDSLFAPLPPEGNAHYAEWDRTNQYILAADEDFTPFGVTTPLSITTGPNAGEYEATAVGGAAPVSVLPDKRLNGPTVYGGYGCPPNSGGSTGTPGSPPVPQRSDYDLDLQPGEEAILVLQRGPGGTPTNPHDPSDPPPAAGGCFPGEKAESAFAAGWDAILLVNRHLGSAEADFAFCGSGGFERPYVAVCTTHEAYHLMFNTAPDYSIPYDPEPNTEPNIGDRGERVSIEALFDGWGYLRLLDANTLEELDAYAIAEARDARFASGFGDLSIHETATDPTHDLTYISWYAGGFRVMSHAGGELQEVGHHIDEGGNNHWGVEVHFSSDGKRYILASDRDFGLYIYRYGADVGLRKADTPDIVRLGQTVRYTITASNTGTIAGDDTIIRDRLPANLTLVRATASQGSCQGTRTIICNLGRLPEDGQAQVTIVARATKAGFVTNTARAATADVDYDLANNVARETTRIRATLAPAGCAMSVRPSRFREDVRQAVRIRVRENDGDPAANRVVTLRGAGVDRARRTNAEGVVQTTVRPTRAGTLRVNVPSLANCARAFRVVGAGPALTG